jgi:cobalt transporter subunit CbtB
MTNATKSITGNADVSMLEKLPAVSLAMFLGAFLFFGVAFASPMEIHNAAHDGRHVMAFPCH